MLDDAPFCMARKWAGAYRQAGMAEHLLGISTRVTH